MGEPKRIEVLDFLRAVASLSVAWFHFAKLLDPGALHTAGTYGKLGVQVFFVISGFIIPYSLHRSGYELRWYPTFILKRIIRLDPPYLVTIALIILLGYGGAFLPLARHGVFEATPVQVLLHLGYVNTFFGHPWLSEVFWTLAIEFQYYILMGLVFPLVMHPDAKVRLATMAALAAAGFLIARPDFFFYHAALFLMGVATLQYWVRLIGRGQYAALLALCVAVGLLRMGLPAAAAGSLAVCAILFLRVRHPVFSFLGSISYSIYLIHSPVGSRAMNVALRLLPSDGMAWKLLIIACGMAATILAAYVLYRLVELPSQKLSAAFTYGRRRVAAAGGDELDRLEPAL